MRAVLVVNPTATTTTHRAQEVIAEALAHRAELAVRRTNHRGHARELAATAAADGADLVIALGGDGTVNEVVNGLLAAGVGPQVPLLGIVPGGSTNVTARSLGLPEDAVEATGALLDALRVGRIRSLGMGEADGRWFAFSAGVGFDAAVVAAVEARRGSGRNTGVLGYVSRGVGTYLRRVDRRTPMLSVRTATEQIDDLFLAIVQNTSPWTFLGERPVTACPRASFDTALDLFGLRSLSPAATARAAAGMLAGGRGGYGGAAVGLHDQAWLDLTATQPLPFHLDGDYLGERDRVRLSWTPDALRVLA
jgi:diacylglycerol kinase family enzyme